MEPLELTFEVGCSPEHAFDTWTHRMDMWWPRSHSRSGDVDLVVTMESHVGGRIFERTPTGEEHDWGRVTAWEPPEKVAYLWHIAWPRENATLVTITFEPTGDKTLVRIEHTGWETFGEKAAEMKDRNRGGWSGIVPAFRAAAEQA